MLGFELDFGTESGGSALEFAHEAEEVRCCSER